MVAANFKKLEASETMVSHVTVSPTRRTTVFGGWSGWCSCFLHTILLTVLSSTTTVGQMENIFLNPCVSGVRPQGRVIHSHVVTTEVFPQAHVESPATNREVHKMQACQSTNFNRRQCRWRPEVDSQQVDRCRPASSCYASSQACMVSFQSFSPGQELVLHRSSQLLLFRIRVCSLGFSTIENGLFSIGVARSQTKKFVYWYLLVGLFPPGICSGISFFQCRTHTQRRCALGTIPRTGFSGIPLLLFTRCAVGRRHTRCRLRSSRAQGTERPPLGCGHGGTDAQRLLSWGSRRICFTRQGHEDDGLAIFLAQAELSRRRPATRESQLAICFARGLAHFAMRVSPLS